VRIAYLSLVVGMPLLAAAQTDSPRRLEPEKTIERTLTSGSSDSDTLDLQVGDLVTYVISDLKIASPAHVAPAPDPNESARLKGLSTGTDVAAFWKEIGPEGRPKARSAASKRSATRTSSRRRSPGIPRTVD
jgi:hypothetical protein